MQRILLWLGLAALTAGALIPDGRPGTRISKRSPSSCSGKWLEYKATSTMCLFEDSYNAKDCGVPAADRNQILSVHNRLRANVSPSATNMMKMYWNDDLAALAQKWAKQCRSAHDSNENRYIPGTGKVFIGQSWASGGLYSNWQLAIEDGWYGEVKDFNYGSEYHNGVVGHYTQVVRDEANLIGCGKCSCPQGPLYICNYYKGNSQDKGHPYKSGSRGSACKNNDNGLCDVGNKLCLNGGTLNTETGNCDCVGKFTGELCGSCSGSDDENCLTFYAGKCDQWTNVPPLCPHMCGRCGSDDGGNDDGGNDNGGSDNGGNTHGGGNGCENEVECTDNDENCPNWATRGECTTNPVWMLSNCKLSCSTVTGTGDTDNDENCPYWAGIGECMANPIWMLKNCKLSCSTATEGTCKDSDENCPYWAKIDECSRNPIWMSNNCKLSCDTC